MSLYVRLQSSFWTNRKTLRLRAAIGDSAFWIPPRLWSYAADNQPDGNFSDYTAGELALLLGYLSDAQAMLQALQQAGFMDGMQIHGWEEHNGYHSTFSARASKAAQARWSKEKNQKKESTRNERKGKETSIASRMLVASKSRCSQAEAESFCITVGLPASDGEAMFLHWEEKGWAKVKDWQATIRKWKSFGYMPSQKVKPNGQFGAKTPDPRQSKLDREFEEAKRKYG